MVIDLNGIQVVIFKIKKQYYAINDKCTHAGGRLSKGYVNGNMVTCPIHGATFDLETGKLMKYDLISMEIFKDVENTKTYPVFEEKGIIFLINK